MNVKFPIEYRSDYVDPEDYADLNKKEEERAAEREKGGWEYSIYMNYFVTRVKFRFQNNIYLQQFKLLL